MKSNLENGTLDLSSDVFITIAGYAATNCFGVKGMAMRNVQDGIVQILRRDNLSKGVKISAVQDSDAIDVELHIIVEHGVNIPAVCRSIMEEVRYHTEKQTGVKVETVNIFVDSIMSGK